jgi:hypothetical protein
MFLLFSCVSDGLDRPSEDQIISDLIGRKIPTWSFLNEEEFISLNIKSSEIISTNIFSFEDDELVFDIEGEFVDYYTREKWNGEIFVTYILNNNLTWVFESVDGEISRSENESNENLFESSESFHIEYTLKEIEEVRACDNCSHRIQQVTNIEFPDYTFENFDDENLMNELWEKHKKKIHMKYFGESFFDFSTQCKNCNKGSIKDFYTVDRFTNEIVMVFERN